MRLLRFSVGSTVAVVVAEASVLEASEVTLGAEVTGSVAVVDAVLIDTSDGTEFSLVVIVVGAVLVDATIVIAVIRALIGLIGSSLDIVASVLGEATLVLLATDSTDAGLLTVVVAVGFLAADLIRVSTLAVLGVLRVSWTVLITGAILVGLASISILTLDIAARLGGSWAASVDAVVRVIATIATVAAGSPGATVVATETKGARVARSLVSLVSAVGRASVTTLIAAMAIA